MKKGLVIVYTGKGKGKTTAAFGLCLRMLGHGGRVSIIQFVKAGERSGELSIREKYADSLDIHVTGSGFIKSPREAEKIREGARSAWEIAKAHIRSGTYDLVILDELTYLVSYGLIPEEEVLEIVEARPRYLHIVITGRDATKSLVEIADIVTEMQEVKHSYSKGIKAQRGIEW
jgi:cob(I)alamin adenosyltransferase